MPPENCPNCGADLPRHARACPDCGSDTSTGWSEAAHYGSAGLPDEEFDYADFVKREFGGGERSPRPRGVKWFWWVVAVAVLAAFLKTFVL